VIEDAWGGGEEGLRSQGCDWVFLTVVFGWKVCHLPIEACKRARPLQCTTGYRTEIAHVPDPKYGWIQIYLTGSLNMSPYLIRAKVSAREEPKFSPMRRVTTS